MEPEDQDRLAWMGDAEACSIAARSCAIYSLREHLARGRATIRVTARPEDVTGRPVAIHLRAERPAFAAFPTMIASCVMTYRDGRRLVKWDYTLDHEHHPDTERREPHRPHDALAGQHPQGGPV